MDVIEAVRKTLLAQRNQIDAALVALGVDMPAAPQHRSTAKMGRPKGTPMTPAQKRAISKAVRAAHQRRIAKANGSTGEAPTIAPSAGTGL